MTAQFNDLFELDDIEYSVAGISEGELFDVSLLGIKPMGICTACYRGYLAIFSLLKNHLVLQTLQVNLLSEDESLDDVIGPTINDIVPTGKDGKYDLFNNHYENINYHLEYSGGLLIADGFIEDLYVHMGFHPAWKYETVCELIFENGILMANYDRSDQMAEIREDFINSKSENQSKSKPSREEITQFVEAAFDRSYRM